MKAFIGIISPVFLGCVIVFGLSFGSYEFYKFFNPRYEQVRYDTFKQSQAYNDGMLRDLTELKREYLKASPEQKEALRALTLHRFEVYDIDRLPNDLQNFYRNLLIASN